MNTESFQAEEYGEMSIKREAKLLNFSSNIKSPSTYEH